MLLAETEGMNTEMEGIMKQYMTSKHSPKIAAGAIQTLTKLFSSVGNECFPIKPFVESISTLGHTTNAHVRAKVITSL